MRPVDQIVLELLARYRTALVGSLATASTELGRSTTRAVSAAGMTVPELTQQLEVTPTAVRQRLERLIALELIERHKESVGRGRPQFRYRLTQLGRQFTAANYADLAKALWQELLDLPNPRQRLRLMQRVAMRMGRGLKAAVPVGGSIRERMSAAASELGRRKISAGVNVDGKLPVLQVHSCPYPDLAESDEGRQLCELEQEMLSEAIGETMRLDCCRLDGHENCQFRPVLTPVLNEVDQKLF